VNSTKNFAKHYAARRSVLLAGLLLLPGISFPLVLNMAFTPDVNGVDEAPKPVRVGIIQAGRIVGPDLPSRFRGVVVPRRESNLAFRRPGRIELIRVEAGDSLSKGQIIAELDAQDLKAQLRIAESELELARAELQEAIEGPRSQTITSAEARVAQLQARYRASQRRLERRKQLAAADAVSQEEIQDESLLAEQLAENVREAQAELEQLQEGTRVEQINAAQARVARAEASVGLVEVQLRDSRIVAPFDCVIAERFVDEGTIVDPAAAVVEVMERPPLEAIFGLPPEVAREVRVGQQVAISIGKNVDERVQPGLERSSAMEGVVAGAVVRRQPRIDPITNTREVVVQFDTEDPALCGLPAALWLPTDSIEPAISTLNANQLEAKIWIPSEALVRGVRGLWAVYVLATMDQASDSKTVLGTAELRDVQVVQTAGLLTQIAGDIDTTDWLITQGLHRIGPGVHVAGIPREAEKAWSHSAEGTDR
jgi:HlyD family secretion protein